MWGQSWHLRTKKLAAYSWQRCQLSWQWNWSLFSSFRKRKLSRGDSSLIGMACYSLWAVSPGEAANEVPVWRRFFCSKLLSAENWTRCWCIGRAVCGNDRARIPLFSWICKDLPPLGCVARRNKGTKSSHPREGIPGLAFLAFIRIFFWFTAWLWSPEPDGCQLLVTLARVYQVLQTQQWLGAILDLNTESMIVVNYQRVVRNWRLIRFW